MAAIVYLDVDDEITSAATRLRTLEDDRIALVLPLGSRLATSRINFRLLAREAATRKKTLEIVTGDASTRALAASAGLPTHTSVAAFEGRPEPGAAGRGAGAAVGGGAAVAGAAGATGGGSVAAGASVGATGPIPGAASTSGAAGPSGAAGRSIPSPTSGRGVDDSPTVVTPIVTALPAIRPPMRRQPVPQVGRRQPVRLDSRMVAIALGIVAILIVGGVAAYQLLPSATVTLAPGFDLIGPIQLSVTAQSGITQPDPTRLLVPARTFSYDLDVSDTFPATGVKVDETTADGVVTFTNCDIDNDQRIKSGAIVATQSGIQFRTLHDVTLKKAQLGNFQINCKSNDVAVKALKPGTAGNVPSNTIRVIPKGYASNTVFVTNGAATSGGAHVETKQVTQANIDAALVALNDKLVTAFDDKIAAAEGVPQGTTLFTETKVLGKANPGVDPRTLLSKLEDTFQLGLTAKGTIVGADPSPVSTLADARIRSSVKDGFNLVEDSIRISVGTPLVTGSTITFPVLATATATRQLDAAALRKRIHGLGLPQARTVLREFGTVTITVWPNWVTTIPTNDDRLAFTITAPPAPSASPSRSRSAAPTPAPTPAASGSAP